MTVNFYVETRPVDNGPTVMNSLIVSVFERSPAGVRQIGEYPRNHAGIYDTFHPFQLNGNWYALYSRDYTATRVMELPTGRNIAGEEPESNGFCPVDFYVPYADERVIAAGHAGQFGFVAGCKWGDDSSWKIQYLDLSGIESGIFSRQERFGYLSIPADRRRLAECISFDSYYPPDNPTITITAELYFRNDGTYAAYA
jgi:hypothetical protein